MTPIESPAPYLLFEDISEQNYLFPDEVADCRFEGITPESLRSMAEKTMGRCDEIFEQILNCEDLTYDKILRPLSEIDDLLQQIFNYLSVSIMLHPEQEVRQAAAETSMTVLRASNGYLYSFDVDKKILAYSRTQQAKELEGEEEHYLDSSLQQRISAGHGLPRAQRKKVRKLQTSLFELEIDFLSNIAEDQTTVILDSSEIVGLDEQDKKSYLIDLGEDRYALHMSDGANLGFLRLAANRQARQKAYLAYNSRLRDANELILQKAVDSRQRVAWLLGYESWLHFTYEYNMAESPEVIFDMYKEVIGPISAKAKNELAEMEQMLEADGHSGPLQAYDWEYYENKLLNEKSGVKLDKVREYFPLPAVLDGVFDLTGEMFGLTYRPIDVATWHPDVLAFAVDDRQSGQQIGEIYMDLFSREGKYKHCCTQSLVSGRALPDGTYRQPSSLIIANLTRPVDGEPALLSTNLVMHFMMFLLNQNYLHLLD
jgi:Zn-dependent oligopeptidase